MIASSSVIQESYPENWQTAGRTIRDRCEFLFNKDILSDVKFVVQVASDESESKKSKKVISAHKFVLSISSPVFYTMFYGELPETRDFIELPDCDYDSLLEFVRFIYSDKVELSGSNVMQVLYLSKKYMVPSLADKCREFLESHMYPSTVFSVLPFAELHEDEKLAEHCWMVIDRQTNVAVKSDEFEAIDRSLLQAFVERNSLNIAEIKLFEAVSRWATKQCEKQGLVAEGQVKRRVLGERIIKAIRFPIMGKAEFTSVVVKSGILTDEETGLLDQYFNSTLNQPVGFPEAKRNSSSRGEGVLHRCKRFRDYYNLGTWMYNGETADSILFEVWDACTGDLIYSLGPHPDCVRSASFSLDNMFVCTGCDDGTVRIWSVADGRELTVCSKHDGWVTSCWLSRDSELLVSVSNNIKWWKSDGTLCQQFNLKGVQAKSIHISPDFKAFVSVDNVGMIYVLKRITP